MKAPGSAADDLSVCSMAIGCKFAGHAAFFSVLVKSGHTFYSHLSCDLRAASQHHYIVGSLPGIQCHPPLFADRGSG